MVKKEKLVRLFDRQAKRYAKGKDSASLKRWRQELIRQAEGEVLELAVGAGANFPYYPSGVKVTATDFSEEMLRKARVAAAAHHMDAVFICGDIEKMSFDEESFDTIVSTLSFCCYENPLGMFQKIQRWCKPDGNILLLEHGISSHVAISTFQRTFNPLFCRVVGCHHNRDMLELVKASGIEIDKVESHWFNMVHLIWAKPGTRV
ncbi:class I SAM-dependent methyltransferase [Siminovitchia sp. FSL H7-0308]|uniref:class I SAM-dependent methyltransferase n=1 Tax=Siminovitchia TaxID=2837510 RepID=UPI001BC9996A|nr:class I SAM-dependent methyltransferase [Siminovitchia thermophila]